MIAKIRSEPSHYNGLPFSQTVCFCTKPFLLTVPSNNEIVCSRCGVVFGYDEYYDVENTIPFAHITKTKSNLFQKRQIGCNPYDVKKLVHTSNLRLDKNKSNQDIAPFADICDKLKLSQIISEDCWQTYRSIRKNNNNRFTRAKAICLAIYQICRSYHIPFSEDEIRSMVCQSLGVKKAPMLKSVVFKTKSNSYVTDNAEKERFYLNLHLSQAQKNHNIEDITILKRTAIRYYYSFTNPGFYNNGTLFFVKNNTDHNTLAKRAVTLALQRCIVN